MKNRSDWDTFYRSGKVEDYLTYCSRKEENETKDSDRGLKIENAEFYGGFRAGTESGTYRGI